MDYFEYKTEKAIVRIHPGNRTEEERKVVLENACERFFKAIQKTSGGNGNRGNGVRQPSCVHDVP